MTRHVEQNPTAADTAAATAPPPVVGPSVVAVFSTHEYAETAIHQLRYADFDMERLSIVGRDYYTEESPIGFYNQGDRIRVWGGRGAFWGALIGLLFTPAFFFIPVIGHIVLLGPLTAALVSALGNGVAVGGLSALGAALYGIGIPHDTVVQYEIAIRAGQFLLIVHDTDDDAELAVAMLKAAGADSVEAHE